MNSARSVATPSRPWSRPGARRPAVLIAAGLVLLSGCGQKGPLYLPAATGPSATTPASAPSPTPTR